MSGMQKKTEEKLQREFLSMPLHHIDTNVIIEAIEETKSGESCSDYLNRVGYKYRGTISLPVLGEFLLVTLREKKPVEDKEFDLRRLNAIINKSRIQLLSPLKSSYQTADKIMEIDTRIEPTDALNYSMAVQENADAFVSLDGKLILNATLENAFGVAIKHPSQL